MGSQFGCALCDYVRTEWIMNVVDFRQLSRVFAVDAVYSTLLG